jgi:hypothetical protein
MIFNAVILGLLATVGLAQAASVKREVYQGYGEHFLNYDMYPQKKKRENSRHVEATILEPGSGACGIDSSAGDHTVAVSASFFDTFP